MDIDREGLLSIMQWLLRHPEELILLRTAAALDYEPETIWPEVGEAVSALRKKEVERYFQSAMFGWCSLCLLPCVTFADGIRIEWPSRERHECAVPAPRYHAVAV